MHEMTKTAYVYMLANKRGGTLYVGVTSDIVRRVWEHKSGLAGGFSKRYGLNMLVWMEVHDSWESAIRREKSIKDWHRRWKIQLIERENPAWRDLYAEIL